MSLPVLLAIVYLVLLVIFSICLLPMPETCELYIFHCILCNFIDDCAHQSHSLQVIVLWFDCKGLEICNKLVIDKKSVKDHVIPLTSVYAHLI